MTPSIDVRDIPPEVRESLGLAAPAGGRRRRKMSKDDVRSHALRVLAVVAALSQAERARVLAHALKVNAV